jgi:heme-degrading monooxygenase HmoA
MVLEAVMLTVRPGTGPEYEEAFRSVAHIIASMPGYLGHALHRCLEVPDRYLLLVQWHTVDDHERGFRQSAGYQEWKRALHHFYDPFPTVHHFEAVNGGLTL